MLHIVEKTIQYNISSFKVVFSKYHFLIFFQIEKHACNGPINDRVSWTRLTFSQPRIHQRGWSLPLDFVSHYGSYFAQRYKPIPYFLWLGSNQSDFCFHLEIQKRMMTLSGVESGSSWLPGMTNIFKNHKEVSTLKNFLKTILIFS